MLLVTWTRRAPGSSTRISGAPVLRRASSSWRFTNAKTWQRNTEFVQITSHESPRKRKNEQPTRVRGTKSENTGAADLLPTRGAVEDWRQSSGCETQCACAAFLSDSPGSLHNKWKVTTQKYNQKFDKLELNGRKSYRQTNTVCISTQKVNSRVGHCIK